MYGYEEYNDITPGQVLQKVTQEQIFEWILEQPFSVHERYKSPFRFDKKPGCRFEVRPDGTCVFVDFGERLRDQRKIYRSCFSMVMDKFKVSLNEAVNRVCTHFGIPRDLSQYKPITVATVYKVGDGGTNDTIIKFDKKAPNKADTKFWSQFLIPISEVLEDNVHPVRNFSVKNNKGFRLISPYSNCYAMDFIDAVKLYQPYNARYKWITNCNANHIGNIDNLPATGDELIIQKSYKDHKVLRILRMGLSVIWFQNEGCVPDLAILKNLTERFKLITIFFDNDETGILAALKLCEIINKIRDGAARMVHLPQFTDRQLKDPGAFISKEGRQDTIQVLKQIGIHGTT